MGPWPGRKSRVGVPTYLPLDQFCLYLWLAYNFQIQCCGKDTSGWITCRFYVSSLRTLTPRWRFSLQLLRVGTIPYIALQLKAVGQTSI